MALKKSSKKSTLKHIHGVGSGTSGTGFGIMPTHVKKAAKKAAKKAVKKAAR